MPKGVLEYQVVDNAKSNSIKAIVLIILLIVLQFLIRQNIDKLIDMYTAVQILLETQIYDTKMPINVVLVFKELRSFLNFEKVSPSYLLNLIFPHRDFNKMFGQKKENISQFMIELGIQNLNFFRYFGYFFLAVSIFILATLIIYLLRKIEKFRAKLTKKLLEIKRNLIWNGIIDICTIEYLKLAKYWFIFIKIEYRG